jgi:hypothetical protein
LEAALIFLPFFALLLGIINFSLAIFVRNTLTSAVREGVRYGVTSRTSPPLGHDASIKAVVQQHAYGFLSGTNGQYLNIRYFDPVAGAFVTGAGSNRSGNILEVRVTGYPWLWIAPLWLTQGTLTFNVESADLMEAQPSGIPAR